MTSPPLSPAWGALAHRVVVEYRAAIGDNLVAIVLFGSVAWGQARSDSDLDLYVVTQQRSLGDARLQGMWGRIDASPEYQALVRAGYQPTPSPVPHTVDELARHPWILLDIAHHGVILYDPGSVLERELDAVRRRMAELGSKRLQITNADRAVIDPAKLQGYLLSRSHSVGRFKAAFFLALGYSPDDWRRLEVDLRSQHLSKDATPEEHSAYGQTYAIHGAEPRRSHHRGIAESRSAMRPGSYEIGVDGRSDALRA